MLGLVTDAAPAKTETCPETLLFDVHRLGMLQTEYRYITTVATMLSIVGNALAATRNPSDAQLIGIISETFVDESRTVINVEQSVTAIGEVLERSTMSPDARDALKRQLLCCAAPTDAVNQLFAQRTRIFWSRIDQNGTIPVDFQFMNSARVLLPRLEKAASTLRKVTNLNRLVHHGHYNRIIGEEAQKIKDEQKLAADAMSDN